MAQRVNKTISKIKEPIEADLKSTQAHNNLGLIYGKHEGRYEEALDEFRKAIEIDPKSGEARCNLAIAYYLLGDDDQALRHLKVARLLGATPDARFIEALKSGRVNGRVRAQAVGWSPSQDVLAARRRNALAVATLAAVAILVCTIYFLLKGARFSEVKRKGFAPIDTKKARETLVAKETFIPAVRLDLIESRLAEDLFDEAISECRMALDLHPTDAGIYNLLAQAYHGKEMWDEEIRERKKVIELNPDWPATEWAALHNNIGVAYIEKGAYDLAIAEFKKTIELWPEDAEAYNNLGYAFGQKGVWEEAIEMYRSAVEFKPDFKEAHYNLALALAQTRSFEEAWKEVRLAEELGYPAQPLIDELTKVFPEP